MHVAEGTLAFRGTEKKHTKKAWHLKLCLPRNTSPHCRQPRNGERTRDKCAQLRRGTFTTAPCHRRWAGRKKKKKVPAKLLRSFGVWRDTCTHAISAFARRVSCQLKSVTPCCEFEYLWVVSRASLHNSKAVYFGLCWPPRSKRWWNMKTDAHSVVWRIIRRETSVSPAFVLHLSGLYVSSALRHGPHLIPGSPQDIGPISAKNFYRIISHCM